MMAAGLKSNQRIDANDNASAPMALVA